MPEFSPTFLKRDPVTGRSYYDFDGHVKAWGVDLPWWNPGVTFPEAPPLPQQDISRVAWRDENGVLVAEVHTEPGYLSLRALPNLIANGGPGTYGFPNAVAVRVQTDAQMGAGTGRFRTLLSEEGYADYAQVTPWQAATRGGAFDNYGGAYGPARFRIYRNPSGDGWVELAGLVKGNQAWGPGFAVLQGLPVPQYDVILHTICDDNAVVRLDAKSGTGQLMAQATTVGPAKGGAGSWLSLDNLRYPLT